MFLLAAALVVGGMYLYDSWQTSLLDDREAEANRIEQDFHIDGAHCQIGSAGLRGEELVFRCEGIDAHSLASTAAGFDHLPEQIQGFSAAVFIDQERQLRCPVDLQSWPEHCEDAPLGRIE